MTSKNEGSGKDAGRPGDVPGQKRPHATLDLKAIEIKTAPAAGPASAPSTSPASAASTKDAASAAKPAEPAASKPVPAAAVSAPPASAGSKNESPPQPAKPASAAAPETKKAEPAKPAPARPSVAGRLLGHAVSGICGGAAALYVLHWLPEGNALKPFSPVAEKLRLLEIKLADVQEAATAIDTDPEVVKKLDDAVARLSKMEGGNSAALTEAVAKIEAESKALSEKIAKEAPNLSGAAERIAKLEDRLSLMAAAAGSEADKSSVAQLAAITGRIADIENKVTAEMAGLRKSIPEEVGSRVAQISEASEAAKAGAQRNDRELQALKTDAARVGQRVETLKADSDRLTASLEAVKQEQGQQSSALDALKASVDGQLKALAKPADISSAVAPVAGKIAALEKNLESVVRSEVERRADAERIVVSLELANLKRALDRGQGFSAELAAVRKVAGDKLDLAALEKFKASGVPPLADLESDFRGHINRVLDVDSEPEDASFVDRIVSGAKSVVRVRRVSHNPDDKSTEAVVARAEAALKDGQLGEAIEHVKQIPAKAGAILSDWLSKAEARHSVDRAIAAVETELKSSLGAQSSAPAEPAGQPQPKQE